MTFRIQVDIVQDFTRWLLNAVAAWKLPRGDEAINAKSIHQRQKLSGNSSFHDVVRII